VIEEQSGEKIEKAKKKGTKRVSMEMKRGPKRSERRQTEYTEALQVKSKSQIRYRESWCRRLHMKASYSLVTLELS
jgi:hypothetical protein